MCYEKNNLNNMFPGGVGSMNEDNDEEVIFKSLESVCSRKGYVHALTYLCYESGLIDGRGDNHLIHSEISILAGLLVKNDIDFFVPDEQTFHEMINQTKQLLKRLHECLCEPMKFFSLNSESEKSNDYLGYGKILREAFLYGGETAHYFQYLDFSILRYKSDNCWMKRCKGFSIDDAVEVVRRIVEIINSKKDNYLSTLININSDPFAMISPFIFDFNEVFEISSCKESIARDVLNEFTLNSKNKEFNNISSFNELNARPIVSLGDNRYLLFQSYGLVKAVYESPYYWMVNSKEYSKEASINRGVYVEIASYQLLKKIFGNGNIFMNVHIHDIQSPKSREKGEIDVLVIFGNKAIILQVKSKRLTINARKGKDEQIIKDFYDSVESAYEQGVSCAKLLLDENNTLRISSSVLSIDRNFSEIYIICLVPDHYPALSYQVRSFLKIEKSNVIMPPLVMDIFNLDVMVQILQSPFFFLGYLRWRAKIFSKMLAKDEIVILAYFMKNGFFDLDLDNDITYLDNSVGMSVDEAMVVKGLGIADKPRIDGVISDLMDGNFGKILQIIYDAKDKNLIEIVTFLLDFNCSEILKLEEAVGVILMKSDDNAASHDLSIFHKESDMGLTIWIDRGGRKIGDELMCHCDIRKYIHRAKIWYGLYIDEKISEIKFFIKRSCPWLQNEDMAKFIAKTWRQASMNSNNKIKIKVNEKCPCGSGIKYKKCCQKYC